MSGTETITLQEQVMPHDAEKIQSSQKQFQLKEQNPQLKTHPTINHIARKLGEMKGSNGKMVHPPMTWPRSIQLLMSLSLVSLLFVYTTNVISNKLLIAFVIFCQLLMAFFWDPATTRRIECPDILDAYTKCKNHDLSQKVAAKVLYGGHVTSYHDLNDVVAKLETHRVALCCTSVLSFILSVVAFVLIVLSIEGDKLSPAKVKPEESIRQMTQVFAVLFPAFISPILLLKFCVDCPKKHLKKYWKYVGTKSKSS